MKAFLNLSLIFSLIVFSSISRATGPNASGGIPETDFYHDMYAISIIIQSPAVFGLASASGPQDRVRAVVPDRTRRDIYLVITTQCELHMAFSRVCSPSVTGMPNCQGVAKPLLSESRGNCRL
jgi:hypothetical protein